MMYKLRCLCKLEITKFHKAIFVPSVLAFLIPSISILFGKLLIPVGPITIKFFEPIYVEETQLIVAGITVIISLILTVVLCVEKN